jgi:ppGpp synthetase/RelA/SpoT-type nucleotidyltranferase
MSALHLSKRSFEQVYPMAEIAERDLKRRVADALRSLGDPNLVRARFDEARIKDLDSIERKARQNGWSGKDALQKATDLVGLRVVCNNLQDVRRAAELIKSALKVEGIRTFEQDYITQPRKDGYLAIHLDVRVPTRLHKQELNVGCEIQIRSLLQDAWARLSHADIYGSNVDIPDRLLRKLRRLSRQLADADGAADLIRNEMARPRRGHKPSKGAKLTRSAIAFLYRRAFGEEPATYLVDLALKEFSDAEIRADGLDQALRDRRLNDRLKHAYQSYMPYPPSHEEIFMWVVRSLVQGRGAALRQARLAGRNAWEEVDQIYGREILSDLPDTMEELLTSIEHPSSEPNIEGWADAMGAAKKCAICGTTIVDPESLAMALIDHYDLTDPDATDAQERIESAIRNSGVEVGDWDHSDLCAYHGNQLSKDD